MLSNVCKLMERMVNERLMCYLEKRGMVAFYQSGFRRGRDTTDSVLCLEDDIRRKSKKRGSGSSFLECGESL